MATGNYDPRFFKHENEIPQRGWTNINLFERWNFAVAFRAWGDLRARTNSKQQRARTNSKQQRARTNSKQQRARTNSKQQREKRQREREKENAISFFDCLLIKHQWQKIMGEIMMKPYYKKELHVATSCTLLYALLNLLLSYVKYFWILPPAKTTKSSFIYANKFSWITHLHFLTGWDNKRKLLPALFLEVYEKDKV